MVKSNIFIMNILSICKTQFILHYKLYYLVLLNKPGLTKETIWKKWGLPKRWLNLEALKYIQNCNPSLQFPKIIHILHCFTAIKGQKYVLRPIFSCYPKSMLFALFPIQICSLIPITINSPFLYTRLLNFPDNMFCQNGHNRHTFFLSISLGYNEIRIYRCAVYIKLHSVEACGHLAQHLVKTMLRRE